MIRAFILLCCLLATPPAQAQCRQALLLALDVSGSIDNREYRLQLDGLAAALKHPDVQRALLGMPSTPVHLAVFEWSSPVHQRKLVDWTAVTGREDLERVTARLAATRRVVAPPGTGLGTAMRFGAELLREKSSCWKRTLDISGDGKHNTGEHPRDVHIALSGSGITINALVIGADAPSGGDRRQVEIAELSSYFRVWVITGPDAFVETALGFDDYKAAMVRKLKRELESPVLSYEYRLD